MTSSYFQRRTAERRRFWASLAASLLVNAGVLLWAGWLSPPPVVRPPRARPHLGMMAFRISPPAAPARPGVTSHTRTAPVRPRRAASKAVPAQPKTTPPKATPPKAAQTKATQPRPRPARPEMPRVLVTRAPARREVPRPEQSKTPPRPQIAVPQSEVARALPNTLPPPLALPPPAMPPLRVAQTVKKRLPPAPRPVPAPAAHPAASLVRVAKTTPAPPAQSGLPTVRSGAGKAAGQPPAGPFGIGVGLPWSNAPRHVVYVLDISGSMKTRIRRADWELETALRELHTDDTFNIIAFSDDSRLFGPNMVEASPQSVQRAGDFLADLPLGGQTNLEDAIARALMLRDVNEVVVLTDGVPTVGDTDFATLARTIRRVNVAHARISTIGLVGVSGDGTDQSFEASGLLEQIAHDSGGASKLVLLGQ